MLSDGSRKSSLHAPIGEGGISPVGHCGYYILKLSQLEAIFKINFGGVQ